jgi:hypothetical protein
MTSFIAAFALQQLHDMEELQRDSGARRARRRRRRHGLELPKAPAAPATSHLLTLPHQTRRTAGVSPSTKGATEH